MLTIQKTKQIPVAKWVENLVGMSENEFRKNPRSKFISTIPHGIFLNKDGRDIKCESIIYDSVKKLEPEFKRTKSIKFVVLSPGEHKNLYVQHLQNAFAKENANLLFQVASNFNGLEFPSELSSCEDPNFLTSYCFDNTQGPAASISAGGAAITRLFFGFDNKH